jgi:hypothetical protein
VHEENGREERHDDREQNEQCRAIVRIDRVTATRARAIFE